MEYHGSNGGLFADATCQSWMQILSTQCSLLQGGGVVNQDWRLYVVPYSGPSFGSWAFSKYLASDHSQAVNVSDFSAASQ